VPVPLAVILDGVTAAHDFPREVCITLDARTHAKEGGERSVLGELRQNLRSDIGVRSVVDGDGDARRDAVAGGQADPVGSQQLAARPKPGRGQGNMVRGQGPERPGPQARARQRRGSRTQVHGGGRIQ